MRRRMRDIASSPEMSARRELLRWGASFLFVIAAHGAAALAVFIERDRGEISEPSDAVVMDFVTLPTMDAPPREIAPGIEQVQTEAAPSPSEAKPDPAPEVEPVKTPVQVSEVQPRELTEAKPAIEEPIKVPEVPQIPEAEVELAAAMAPPPKPVEEQKEKSEKKAEEIRTPPVATAPETTAPTAATVRSASLVSWKLRIATHLHRYKRYPPAAAARGEKGTTEVAIVVDRNGRVLSASLQRGSGNALFDEETMALIQRAQPLPVPPGDVSGNEFSFTVPVRYMPK